MPDFNLKPTLPESGEQLDGYIHGNMEKAPCFSKFFELQGAFERVKININYR